MKKFLKMLLAAVVLVVLAGGAFVGKKLYDKYSEGTEWADLNEYFAVSSLEEGALVFDGVILEDKGRVIDGTAYLKLSTIQRYLHDRFYYSEQSQEIRYTDAATVVVAALGQNVWYTTTAGQTETYEEDYVIARTVDEVCYIALDFIEKYVPVTHAIYREPDRVVMESMELCKEVAAVNKDTAVRWKAGVKSDILTEIPKGTQVMILDDEQVEGWVKVAVDNGCIGYVKERRLGTRAMEIGVSTLAYTEPEYTSVQLDGKVRLGFHAVYNMTANGNLESMLETAYNINVISPTWFALNDNYGNFSSIASQEYVSKAHERGIQVWALVEDITNDVDTYQILGNSEYRTHLIEGLVDTAMAYDLDGLNIDLEGIRSREGVHFVQFLRELSIKCREAGLVLSVDNYPPNEGNAYYDYEEQGIVADYVILMGYDEHWGGCGDPGSTASQPFVEQSLDKLLSMVDASKVVNALPFYTRLWKTSGETVTDKAVIMKAIEQGAADLGMTVVFDDATGQQYGSVERDGVLYEMWFEDLASIENKLIAVQSRNLAGVAAWRLGYEEQSVWELIGNYIQ